MNYHHHQQQQPPTGLRIQKARTTLLLDHPFFGTLLFRLGGRPSSSIATMATDGVSLLYNPEFVETLNAAELAGVLAHEVMHPALQHHTRRGDRDPARWNIACDYAINPMLLDAGLTLPKDVLIDNRFRGMSAERIYNLIEEDEKQEGDSGQSESQAENGSSAPKDDSAQNDEAGSEPQAPLTPGGVGQVLDAPEPEEQSSPSVAEQEREWQIAVDRQKPLPKWLASFREGLCGLSKPRKPRKWTGASCCGEPGPTRSHPTTAGRVPTGAMSGPDCICRESYRKGLERSRLPSTAPGQSAPGS